ncbi:hypothetical protein D0Z07_4120 [Hyphodiscus hymeniophilus]|uniref:Rhodopsin domain-containing protein n=1 Tax=Hyphodiscus hymeniophilus TaxID=353542 RepID=A0A9P6VJZ6_9HELO|nr:hypothetical protein D0Z07_4120 [Hyphodiscus hymeniophilus]
MPNSTCQIYSNCTILDGANTNGTIFIAFYNASAPVPYWHQRMELATICIFNSLSLLIIVARVAYRWSWLHRFRGDDRWIAVAGVRMLNDVLDNVCCTDTLKVLLIGYFASQIGTNFEFGWAGYYIIASLIKISVCFTFLEILPHHRTALRYSVFGLATFIGLLGLTLTFAWYFQCTPFLSNFVWSIDATSCVNYDIFRWMWIGLSIPIDLLIVAVPLRILHQTRMPERERRILRLVFGANLLGTIACILGIYGVYFNRISEANEGFYHETVFIMMNDIEIFMYRNDPSYACH